MSSSTHDDPLKIYCPGCNEAFLGLPGNLLCPRCQMPILSADISTLDTMLWHSADRWLREAVSTAQEDLEVLVGQRVGMYELESLLGRGGMGWVFLGRHLQLNRACALKVLSPRLVGEDPEYLDRFCTEGQAAASLVHPNVVTVHAIGQDQGLHFLEMEFVPGQSLQHLLETGPIPALRAATLALGVAEGLSVAHRMGVIHRDLKPDNIMLTHQGIPKIADFGLAKRIRGQMLAERAGLLVGTPYFMAPELFAGAEATPASDIYALGVCLFYMIAGKLPFKRANVSDLIKSVTTERPASLRDLCHDAPLELTECISVMLDKTPGNRPRDGIEAAQLLRAVLGQTRDVESLLHEALDGEQHVDWQRIGQQYRIDVRLKDGRRQTVYIEISDHPFHDRLLQIYSLCCPAEEHYYRDALTLNSQLFHGALALREVNGKEYFVMHDAYPRGTVDAEEIRRSVLELAMHADSVEHHLTGDDDH